MVRSRHRIIGPDDPTISYFSGVYSIFHRFIKEHVDALQPDKHNRYVYCYNNPVNLIDPLGLDPDNNQAEGAKVEEEEVRKGEKYPEPVPHGYAAEPTRTPGQTAEDVKKEETSWLGKTFRDVRDWFRNLLTKPSDAEQLQTLSEYLKPESGMEIRYHDPSQAQRTESIQSSQGDTKIWQRELDFSIKNYDEAAYHMITMGLEGLGSGYPADNLPKAIAKGTKGLGESLKGAELGRYDVTADRYGFSWKRSSDPRQWTMKGTRITDPISMGNDFLKIVPKWGEVVIPKSEAEAIIRQAVERQGIPD